MCGVGGGDTEFGHKEKVGSSGLVTLRHILWRECVLTVCFSPRRRRKAAAAAAAAPYLICLWRRDNATQHTRAAIPSQVLLVLLVLVGGRRAPQGGSAADTDGGDSQTAGDVAATSVLEELEGKAVPLGGVEEDELFLAHSGARGEPDISLVGSRRLCRLCGSGAWGAAVAAGHVVTQGGRGGGGLGGGGRGESAYASAAARLVRNRVPFLGGRGCRRGSVEVTRVHCQLATGTDDTTDNINQHLLGGSLVRREVCAWAGCVVVGVLVVVVEEEGGRTAALVLPIGVGIPGGRG